MTWLYILVGLAAFVVLFIAAIAWSAKGLMTGINRYLHKAPGPPSKFDKVTPR
jgi:hypothetical protein